LPIRAKTTQVVAALGEEGELPSVLPANDTPGPVLIVLPAGPVRPPGMIWPTVRDFVKGKPWAVAVGGGVLVVLVASILLLTQMGSANVANPGSSEPVLHVHAGLELRGGDTQDLAFVIDRNSCAEPLEVRVEGLPEQVKAATVQLDNTATVGQVQVTAGLRSEWPARPIQVSVWANGDLGSRKVAEETVTLTVHKRLLPRLLPPNPIILRPGETRTVKFRIERMGCDEALQLRLSELLAGMSQYPSEQAGRLDTLPLRVSAEADAPGATKIVALAVWLGPHKVEEQLIALTVEKPTPSVHWRMPEMLTLFGGKTSEVMVDIDRFNYKGPVQVRVEALPDGVRCAEATIAADEQSCQLDFQSDEGVVCEGKQIKVKARGGEIDLGEHTFTLIVSKPVGTPVKPLRLPVPEDVTFPTLDGMMLTGKLYPGTKGKDSPCAIVLHDLGATRPFEDWSGVAQGLQKQGLAVLVFEFRGHGASRYVPVDFWTYADNKAMLKTKGPNVPDTIAYRDFPAGYQTYLANDIAAARSFLDQRNDQGELNSANLYLVGAGKGATLGVLWLTTECYRVESSIVQPAKMAEVEGKAIRGAAWLSVEPALLSNKVVSVSNLLPVIGKNARTPMLFVHGKDDTTGTARARGYSGADKPGGDGMHVIFAQAIPGTGVTGQQLLAKDVGGESAVVKHISGLVAQQQLNPWAERGFASKAYQWNFPTPAVAKTVNQPLLLRLPVERVMR
jgi:hypothetical protein